jgi:hypothetical protein
MLDGSYLNGIDAGPTTSSLTCSVRKQAAGEARRNKL